AHQRPVLQLYLPATFDEWLSEPDTPKALDVFIQAPPRAPRWGQLEACMWDESIVVADDDVAADKQNIGDGDGVRDGEAGAEEDLFPDHGASGEDDDGVESWWRDAPPEKMPIPTRLNINGSPTPPRRNSDVATQCKEFWQFVRDVRNEYAIDNRYIINADQKPLWLEMPTSTTVEQTGVKSVPIRSAGYQKQRVTVMLACTATGEKLKLWVFFKCKTLPKGDFPNDVVVGCQANGWMEATDVIQWLDEGVVSFLKPKFGMQSRSAMLVLESYRGHLTKESKARFAVLNIVPAVIPAGCTADMQPLDVSVNKSFKESVRQQYQSWFEADGMNILTPAGNIKKPPPTVVLKWISWAWKAVPADLIKKAFLTCGISNALDKSEDHMVMAHWRSQLSHEVEVDDDIQADGFWGNNATEPESDVEEVEA
ncbi:unnamed protein product, partial [Closterium sp. NIES-54]